MTASDTTVDELKRGHPEPGFDKTAQRILNLFFVLNSSPEPLTTEQIVLDSDLGYGSGNIDSDKRKFRRDRDKLLERGILIKEVRASRRAGDRGKRVDQSTASTRLRQAASSPQTTPISCSTPSTRH